MRNRFAKVIAGSAIVGAILSGSIACTTSEADRPQDLSSQHTLAAQEGLAADWVALWNGNYALAPQIISPNNTVHAALIDGGDGSANKGIDGMVALIRQIRAVLPDLVFNIEVGPIVDVDHLVLRWHASGTYSGGFPGAQAPVGRTIAFDGTDTLRTQDGKVAEYWFNADSLGLLRQLGAIEG
ncbi:ester cyclase [Rhodococcus sp. 077-4]|uniref:ester cyclase n=1 Tax=Rhodococcus sp. 077-4 TaxID=2789271 RepID=UPI0039F62C61